MKKLSKKLKLAKETLRSLEAISMANVLGAATEKTVCATACITNCAACNITNRPGTICGTGCTTCTA